MWKSISKFYPGPSLKKKKNQTLNDQSDQSILDVLNAVTSLKDFSEMQNEGEKKKENWTCASD